jgi:hypothetical protein
MGKYKGYLMLLIIGLSLSKITQAGDNAPIANTSNTASATFIEPISGQTITSQAVGDQMFQTSESTRYLSAKTLSYENTGSFGMGLDTQEMFRTQAFFTSIHGDWIIDRRVIIGLCGYGLMNSKVSKETWGGEKININMVYAGVEGGYLFQLGQGIALRTQLLLGITSMVYHLYNFDNDDDLMGNDTMVIEPGIYLDVPIWEKLGILIGTHYHYTMGAAGDENITDEELSALAAEVVIRVQGF